MFNLDLYFRGLERKYGNTKTLIKFKEAYMEYMRDLPLNQQIHLLRSLKAGMKVEFDVYSLRGSIESLVKEFSEEVSPSPITDAKPILEDLLTTLDIYKEMLENLK